MDDGSIIHLEFDKLGGSQVNDVANFCVVYSWIMGSENLKLLDTTWEWNLVKQFRRENHTRVRITLEASKLKVIRI